MASSEEIAAPSSICPQDSNSDEDSNSVVESSETYKRKLPEIENERADDDEDENEDEKEEDEEKRDNDNDSDEEDELLKEQFRLYHKQLEETEGFGITFLPKPFFGAVYPFDITSLDDSNESFRVAKDCACTAIKQHNLKQGGKLEFEKLLQVTYRVCAGYIFYLTFDAKDSDTGDTKTYQAQVYFGIDCDMTVDMFRLKPENQALTA